MFSLGNSSGIREDREMGNDMQGTRTHWKDKYEGARWEYAKLEAEKRELEKENEALKAEREALRESRECAWGETAGLKAALGILADKVCRR